MLIVHLKIMQIDELYATPCVNNYVPCLLVLPPSRKMSRRYSWRRSFCSLRGVRVCALPPPFRRSLFTCDNGNSQAYDSTRWQCCMWQCCIWHVKCMPLRIRRVCLPILSTSELRAPSTFKTMCVPTCLSYVSPCAAQVYQHVGAVAVIFLAVVRYLLESLPQFAPRVASAR